MKHNLINIGKRSVGLDFAPLVIAEIGINHEGDIFKAIQMVDDAHDAGCECVKFQCHVVEDEMVPAARKVIPGNANESIYEIMERCSLTAEEETELKDYTEGKGMIYLSTPFSRAAADRLNRMKVVAYKIGSGECNNYPLIEHVAQFGKPMIVSTGMNDIESIRTAVKIIRRYGISYALLHCTSMYPTPPSCVYLGALQELQDAFPDAVIGFSHHARGSEISFAAIGLGASVIEKHFTSCKSWPGPDVPISMDPAELSELVAGARTVFEARGGSKKMLEGEKPTIAFAYASGVTIKDVREGDVFTEDNIWVKRPGTGDFPARAYNDLLGRKALVDIPKDALLRKEMIVPREPERTHYEVINGGR